MNRMQLSPSQWLARRLWSFLLWILRRPLIKRLRRRMIERQKAKRVPEWLRIDVQDRVAMRYGQRILSLCFSFLFLSVLFTGSYLLVLRLYETGQLQPPESVRAYPLRDMDEAALRQ